MATDNKTTGVASDQNHIYTLVLRINALEIVSARAARAAILLAGTERAAAPGVLVRIGWISHLSFAARVSLFSIPVPRRPPLAAVAPVPSTISTAISIPVPVPPSIPVSTTAAATATAIALVVLSVPPVAALCPVAITSTPLFAAAIVPTAVPIFFSPPHVSSRYNTSDLWCYSELCLTSGSSVAFAPYQLLDLARR